LTKTKKIFIKLTMGNGVGAMKTMTNILNMGMSDARSGVEREPGEKLPDGERYFGFVNVTLSTFTFL
jgi:hypothetical protein